MKPCLSFCPPVLLLLCLAGCEQRQPAPTETASATTTAPAEAPQKVAPGASSLDELVARAEGAIRTVSAQDYEQLMAHETDIVGACGEAFPGQAERVALARRYMSAKAKIPEALKACSEVTDWGSAVRLGYEGGEQGATPPGCKPDIKRYMDVHVFYQLEDATYRVILRNPVQMNEGKTWVVDREPECSRFVLAKNRELLHEGVLASLKANKDEGLARLSLPNRLVEASCAEPELAFRQGLMRLARGPARIRTVRECAEAMKWGEGELVASFSEEQRVPGCAENLTRAQVQVVGEQGTLSYEAYRFKGGELGERWHLASLPLCKANAK